MLRAQGQILFAAVTLLATTLGFAESPALTAEDVSAYLDGMVPAAMEAGDIAGATVIVVKDDRVLVAKGFGFADVKKHIPVSAEDTLFRPGSISKLFTWTAVMQLVEAGKIDLDRDVNTYLDFKITGYDNKPITMRHLMTHTPGFEEHVKNLLLRDERQMVSLEAAIKAGTPASIYPPGSTPAYSNFGAALAGYIVQRVSGMPFETYIEEKIFIPLGMRGSSFRQPLPKPLAARVSQGYFEASNDPPSFEFCPQSPAGALSATGMDMGNFMLAHLNGGMLPLRGESSRILKTETVEQMHATANIVAPGIDAMALGFYEQNRNGFRAIAHGGDLTAFHSDLLLFPQARTGIFLSFNSLGRVRATYRLRSALTDGFTDRYFPRQTPLTPASPPAGFRDRAEKIAASQYELSRRSDSNFFGFIYVLGQSGAHVGEKGTLLFDALTAPNDKPREFEETAPWHWREVGGQMRLAALLTPDGAVKSVVPDGYGPVFVFQPVPTWRSKGWLQPALIGAGIVLVIASATWLVQSLSRGVRRLRKIPVAAPARARWVTASRLASVAGLLFLAFIVMLIMMFSGQSLWVLTDPAVPLLRLVQLAALLSVLGAVAAVYAAGWSWRTPAEGRWLSVGRTLVALATLICAYIAIAFHFLAIHLQY
jgi:CubicO group peptidase (beta-lactamase class C family)